MKKKMIAALLVATMAAGTLAGCGSKPAAEDNQTATEAADNAAGETKDDAAADNAGAEAVPAADEGTVLNIQCWNEEFKSRV